MTVAELIAELQKMPADAPVRVLHAFDVDHCAFDDAARVAHVGMWNGRGGEFYEETPGIRGKHMAVVIE